MRTWEIVVDLPDDYNIGIGRLITHWAYLEKILCQITYDLLGVGPKHGRIAVRSPRADDTITMIGQLMLLEKVTSSVNLTGLAAALRAIEKFRDLIAHNVWLINPDSKWLCVQDLSGNWKPDPAGPKVSRRVSPEAVQISPEELAAVKETIQTATKTAIRLSADIAPQLEALRKKSPEQTLPDHPIPDQTQKKPPNPSGSSGA